MRISALDRKLLRDFWHMRGQVVTVALIVASGIATYVTMRGAYDRSNARSSNNMRATTSQMFLHS